VKEGVARKEMKMEKIEEKCGTKKI